MSAPEVVAVAVLIVALGWIPMWILGALVSMVVDRITK